MVYCNGCSVDCQFRSLFDAKCSRFKPKTNADRIRMMTDEELAEKLTWIVPYCGDCPARIGNGEECAKDCKKAWLEWLRKEADEEEM